MYWCHVTPPLSHQQAHKARSARRFPAGVAGLRQGEATKQSVLCGPALREPAREIRAHPTVSFRGRPRSALFVDKPEMLASIGKPGVCTVNALSPEVYAGSGELHYGRRGHIPGCLNVYYDALLEGGQFKPPQALRDELAARGLLDADRVIVYCGGGIAATVDGFACQLLGKEDVAVYDGSMAVWVQDPALPLTVAPEP